MADSFICASRGHGTKCGQVPLFEHINGTQEPCYCECHDGEGENR